MLELSREGEEEREMMREWKGLLVVHARESAVRMWARNGFVVDEGMGMWEEVGIGHMGCLGEWRLMGNEATWGKMRHR